MNLKFYKMCLHVLLPFMFDTVFSLIPNILIAMPDFIVRIAFTLDSFSFLAALPLIHLSITLSLFVPAYKWFGFTQFLTLHL